MNGVLAEQNFLMEKIMKEYGGLIKGAVYKASCGQTWSDDVISEVYFAIFLTLRKLGTGWTPPRSFIFTVVRNKVNDFLRQKYRDINGLEEIKKHIDEQAFHKEEVVSRTDWLTRSEFRVFRLLGLGLNNSEIAQSLHVSLHTVRSHVKKIHAKCGVRDRAKLTLISHQACFRGYWDAPEEACGSQNLPQPRRRSLKAGEDGVTDIYSN